MSRRNYQPPGVPSADHPITSRRGGDGASAPHTPEPSNVAPATDASLAVNDASAAKDAGAMANRGRTTGGKFAKGRSGNPKGRPTKSKEHAHETLKRILDEPITVPGQRGTMTTFEALARKTLYQGFNDARQTLPVFKTVMSIVGPPAVAETQDNDVDDAAVIARFRERELRRFGIGEASVGLAANDVGLESEEGPEAEQPRSP